MARCSGTASLSGTPDCDFQWRRCYAFYRNGVCAVQGCTPINQFNGSDRFLRDTDHVAAGAAPQPDLYRGIQSVFSSIGNRSCAVARELSFCRELRRRAVDYLGQRRHRRRILCAIQVAHFLLGLRSMTANTIDCTATSELSLENVNVSFPIYHGGSRSLKKSLLFRGSGGQLASDASHRIVVQALRNISLQFRTGDRVALVGTNGAGKTTLLRAMAGVHEPVTGVIKSVGRISPMFDISLGIDGDMSGYDNIRLRGLILGLSATEIEDRMADIVGFTELGEYLDIPVRTYSSGMMTRLTFAVATCFAPEIVLMDEWIIAGDAAFLVKAQQRIETFVEKAGILVLASHSNEICRRWCNKAVWMERGEVKLQGDIESVLASYERQMTS
jgi:ABC-type polysaccharide/polyol phosphate transport system ATPase subunit